ncbi:MAG: NACHT domain-containing protein, partial [Epsilonproteobacteria bacterium]|nr:NACHT domain-containing protein [Campylobacterota bacterium]
EYEYLFYLPIKKWDKGEGVFDVVFKVLKESLNEPLNIEASTLYEYIQLHKDKTLFIIDGLDEISNEVSREDIFKEIQNFDNYICTSRSEGIKQNEIALDDVFEIEGFGNKSIEKYINTITNTKLSKYLMSNDKLKDLSRNPLLLDIICSLYNENRINFNEHFTMTSLYDSFFDELIYRFENERKIQSSNIKSEEDDIFRELGKIAFENLKNSQFKFKGTFINRSNRRFIENELLLFGFLSSLTKEKHLKDRKYEFIHRSFQEYFAAYYVNTLSPDEQQEIIKEYKFYPHMQMFFVFLAGLIEDKEFLLQEIESEPKDLVGIYEFNLVLQCLGEIR